MRSRWIGVAGLILTTATVGLVVIHGQDVGMPSSQRTKGKIDPVVLVRKTMGHVSKEKSNQQQMEEPAFSNATAIGMVGVQVIEKLASDQKIRRKPFPTIQEQATLKKDLQDPIFLKSLEPLMKTSFATDPDSQLMQTQALDLLLQSNVVTGNAEANRILESVVADSQLEDDKKPLQDRQFMAGLKADLLYQWTSQAPSVSDRLSQLLPGPVSQRIWQNVQDRQAKNLMESQQVFGSSAGR